VAFAFMFMRKMAGTVHYMVPPMYFAMFSTVFSPIVMLGQMTTEPRTTVLDWMDCLLLFLISFLGFSGQVLASRAYQFEKAGRVAPVNNI